MNKDVESAFKRLLDWPHERQEDAVELLKLIEEHDRSPYRLTEDQANDVRHRLAKEKPRALTLSQLDDRLRLRGV